jgi:hypothetical protein
MAQERIPKALKFRPMHPTDLTYKGKAVATDLFTATGKEGVILMTKVQKKSLAFTLVNEPT